MADVKERPIIMTADSVQAILDGRKTQTRRVIRPQPPNETAYVIAGEDESRALCISAYGNGEFSDGSDPWRRCPYGMVGDRLWVKERFFRRGDAIYYTGAILPADVAVQSPIFMPRCASRITLEIAEVRVERVQEISAEDVAAEGVVLPPLEPDRGITWYHGKEDDLARRRFALLWNSINAKRGYPWADNPWVWAITFRLLGGGDGNVEA